MFICNITLYRVKLSCFFIPEFNHEKFIEYYCRSFSQFISENIAHNLAVLFQSADSMSYHYYPLFARMNFILLFFFLGFYGWFLFFLNGSAMIAVLRNPFLHQDIPDQSH
jgi:hypothetical protein